MGRDFSSLTEDGHIERSQERAHSAVGSSLGLALDGGGRALSGLLGAGRGVDDHRLLLGNTALQHVLAEIGHGRALGLQHVLREVRATRARGYGRLENVLAHIRLFTGRAHELAYATAAAAAAAVASTSTLGSRALALSTHGDNVLKSLLDPTTHIGTEAESDS